MRRYPQVHLDTTMVGVPFAESFASCRSTGLLDWSM
jgi:hypothetical protein